MGKLLKYELRKTWMIKLIALGLTAVAEIVFLLGLGMKNEKMLAISTVCLVMLTFGSIMVIGLYSLIVLHRDLNTKQSYMLFMTPNSSYKILGAKVLENGLSMLLAGAAFFALGMLDVTALFAQQGMLKNLWEMITKFLESLDKRLTLDWQTMGGFLAMMLSSWFGFVVLTYLADVISAALLSGKKMSGVVTFLLIIALEILTNWGIQSAMDGMKDASTAALFLSGAGIHLAFAIVMYVLTAWIMDKKLSV